MKKYLWGWVLIGLLLLPNVVLAEGEEEEENSKEVTASKTVVELEECIDSKSARFRLSNGNVEVYSFLALDTDFSDLTFERKEALEKNAAEFVCQFLTNADTLSIEKENPTAESSAVWIFGGDELLQEQMIASGYAKYNQSLNNSNYVSRLLEAEEIARGREAGGWEKEVEVSPVVEEQPEESGKKSLIDQFFDFIEGILDKILACINQMLDSILQKL